MWLIWSVSESSPAGPVEDGRMAQGEKDGSQGDKHDGEREQEMPGEAPRR